MKKAPYHDRCGAFKIHLSHGEKVRNLSEFDGKIWLLQKRQSDKIMLDVTNIQRSYPAGPFAGK